MSYKDVETLIRSHCFTMCGMWIVCVCADNKL